MVESRRHFLSKAVAGTAAIGLAVVSGAHAKPKASSITMVGACGVSCQVCPLMKASKCTGCGSGTSTTAKKNTCPVAKCASMKQIEYCGTDCPSFTKCAKLIGKPYAKEFMEGIKKRLD
jgi:hypothetical protein